MNSFLITNLSLYVFWISDWSLVSSLLLLSTTDCESESESQSVCFKALNCGLRPDFYYCLTVAGCWCVAFSLTRGRICSLQLLLVLANAVILGSESLGTRDHVLPSQIRDFPFRRLLRLAGLREVFEPPPHGWTDREWIKCPFSTQCAPQTEHTLERFVCCNLLVRCHGNACLPNRCPATVYSALPWEYA
jgi:hypothetical protein